MKRTWWPVVACLVGACLQRESAGSFDEPENPCPDPTAELTAAERYLCITALIDDLASGPWVGRAESGAHVASCKVEFGREGSFRLSNTGDSGEFRFLFFPGTTKVEGRYVITDLLEGEFFGQFERESYHTGLENLVITGDELRFSWRSLNSDLSLVTSQLVLTRQR